MPIKAICPECKAENPFGEDQLGSNVECPNCHAHFVVGTGASAGNWPTPPSQAGGGNRPPMVWAGSILAIILVGGGAFGITYYVKNLINHSKDDAVVDPDDQPVVNLGFKDNRPPKLERRIPSAGGAGDPAVPVLFTIEGAIEGEKMKVTASSGKFDVGPQDMIPSPGSQWSGRSQLWIRPTKAGEWVDLELPVAADGEYQVIAYLTKAKEYGIVQFQLDGKKLGKEIDCFEPEKVLATGPIELGQVELKKGKTTLRLEVVGTNEKSVGLRYVAGLDCVVLKKK